MSFEHVRYSESLLCKSFNLIYPSMVLDLNHKPIYLDAEKQVDTIFKALAGYDLTLGIISNNAIMDGGGSFFKCKRGADVDFDKYPEAGHEEPIHNLLTIYYSFFELNLYDALLKLPLKTRPDASDEMKFDYIEGNDWGFMKYVSEKRFFYFEFNTYLIEREFEGFSNEYFNQFLQERFKDEIKELKTKMSPVYGVSEKAFKNSKKRFQRVISEEFGVDVKSAKANELFGKIVFKTTSSAEIKPAIKSVLNAEKSL